MAITAFMTNESATTGNHSSEGESAAPEAIPASTIIIFRNCPEGGVPEILMTVRSRNMAFAGGMAVFPGGRVDPEDFALAEAHAGDLPVDEAAHQIAAIRETLEETGLALGLAGDIDAERADQARAMLETRNELAPVLEAFGWSLDLAQIVPFVSAISSLGAPSSLI